MMMVMSVIRMSDETVDGETSGMVVMKEAMKR